jgi:polyhydroxybutyrate depolymerase
MKSRLDLVYLIRLNFICLLLILIFLQNESRAQIETHSFEFGERTRSYQVFLPQNFRPKMPVVFILHGYLQRARDIRNYTKMSDIADTAGFIAVYPEAVYPGFNSGLKDYPGNPPLPNVDDVGFISNLIDTLEVKYDIDMDRVYCCGLSNGGIMTYRLLGEIGHRFAAFASVAGSLTDLTASYYTQTASRPILHIHGTADAVVYYNGNIANLWSVEETINFWLAKNNCSLQPNTITMPDINTNDGSTVEKISYLNCSDSSCFIFYKVIGGGHSWPGSPQDPDWGKPRNLDINAGSVIWNFFKNYNIVTSIKSAASPIPRKFGLSQNFPNPFNPSTNIEFSIPKSEFVILKIYNLLGQELSTLVSEKLNAGKYQYTWDASSLASGVYLYRLQAGNYTETKKVILVR